METEPKLQPLAYDRIHYATAAGDDSNDAVKLFCRMRIPVCKFRTRVPLSCVKLHQYLVRVAVKSP